MPCVAAGMVLAFGSDAAAATPVGPTNGNVRCVATGTVLLSGSDIAAALFFKGEDSLFGRYWGSRVDQQFLHFETCYYQGQEYAIENGIQVFDSGAQGEHKIQRGFAPVYTYSNHWLSNEEFSRAVENFLKEEKPHVKEYKKQAEKLLPFKKE